jgi:antitoxin ParD1/3/4
MRTTQQMSITLPNEMVDAIRTKVRAGEYATESEVICEGLRAFLNRDRAIESWLQSQVLETYDAIKSDPT